MTVLPDASQVVFTSVISLSQSHTYTHKHTYRGVIRVSDRVQAKPFLFLLCISLPTIASICPTSSPRGVQGQWQGPLRAKSLSDSDKWPLTACPKGTDPFKYTTRSYVCLFPYTVIVLFFFSVITLALPFFSLSLLSPSFSDSNCWPRQFLQSWLSQAALSYSVSPGLAAYTGELNGFDRPWSPGCLGGGRAAVLVGWCVEVQLEGLSTCEYIRAVTDFFDKGLKTQFRQSEA